MKDASFGASTAPPSRNYSRDLHAAIREDHTALNKLITARLPLCLPPHTSNPLLYTLGLTVFSLIYTTFESRLSQHLSTPPTDTTHTKSLDLLRLLDIPTLRRTTRIRQDLSELQRRLAPDQQYLCDAIRRRAIIHTDRVAETLSANPHLLLAHTWAMYLAIFNGGRWIRKHLRDAGREFWRGDDAPLSFWEFHGDADGEDIAQQFKSNFELAAASLGAEEWNEVVCEAKAVFGLCADLVALLDENAGGEEAGRLAVVDDIRKESLWKTRLVSTFKYYLPLLVVLSAMWVALRRHLDSWQGGVFPVVSAKGLETG